MLIGLVTWTYRKSPVLSSSSYGSTFNSLIPTNNTQNDINNDYQEICMKDLIKTYKCSIGHGLTVSKELKKKKPVFQKYLIEVF